MSDLKNLTSQKAIFFRFILINQQKTFRRIHAPTCVKLAMLFHFCFAWITNHLSNPGDDCAWETFIIIKYKFQRMFSYFLKLSLHWIYVFLHYICRSASIVCNLSIKETFLFSFSYKNEILVLKLKNQCFKHYANHML